jgi:hypothetical protein
MEEPDHLCRPNVKHDAIDKKREGAAGKYDEDSSSYSHRELSSPTSKTERLRPARWLCKLAYQRGGPKSAPVPSWAAPICTPV